MRGGVAQCSCGWTSELGPRDESPIGPRESLDEDERLARLFDDTDAPYLPDDEAIAAAGKNVVSAEEARAIWQKHYQRLLEDPGNWRRRATLVHFSVQYANAFAYEYGLRFVRAIQEATLDHAQERRARQDMRACLARGAAREGDLSSAERWIAPCDPRPVSSSEDTTYRLTRAVMALASDAPDEALELVGRQPGLVPIGSRSLLGAALVRAHALEMLGRDQDAIAVLRTEMKARDPGGHLALNRNWIWRPMEICERTLPLASIAHLEEYVRDRRLQVIAGGGMTGAAMVVAAMGAVTGVVALAASQPIVLAGTAMCGVMALVFWGIGHSRRDVEARGRRVRHTGIPARARIDSMQSSGPAINNYAIYEAKATLYQEGAPPRPVTFELFRYERRTEPNEWIKPQAWLPVRVDPNDPSFVVPDAGERPPPPDAPDLPR